jgi:hypothetical protein
MKTMLLRMLPLLAGVMLSACQGHYQPPPPMELGFTRYQPIYLNVGVIENVDEYKSPMTLPNVEHTLPYSPTEAMHIWVQDRLRAVGVNKTLQVIIKDASVVETDLPKPGGVQGFFTDSQDKRYDAKLEVELRIYGDDALSEANIHVSASRTTTIGEHASVAEREAVFRKLIFTLMDAMNAELEKNIYQYFGNDISYSHSQ